jgi:hypothetical protein
MSWFFWEIITIPVRNNPAFKALHYWTNKNNLIYLQSTKYIHNNNYIGQFMVVYFKHNLLGKENNHGHYFQNDVLLFKRMMCLELFYRKHLCELDL